MSFQPPPPESEPPRAWSLRAKGGAVFAAFLLYTAFIATYAWHEKEALLRKFVALQELHVTEATLRQTELAAFLNLFALTSNADAHDPSSRDQIRAHLQDLQRRQVALLQRFPEMAETFASLSHALAQAYSEPSVGTLRKVGMQVNATRQRLLELAERTHRRQQELALAYRAAGNAAALRALGLGLLGAALIAAVSFLFFSRLTRDLRRLRSRVGEVVQGYRGPPLALSSNDEVGQLVAGVNRMVADLAEREQALEIERRKTFSQEKIAAIGGLAAGIVHEIGNPIAAISGLVQSLRDDAERPLADADREKLDLVIEHIERLTAVTRDVSDFSGPQSQDAELLDLNTLVRKVCRLLGHDRRLRAIDLQMALDPALPAIEGVPDHLVQVVMNVLLNAADALQESAVETPRIAVSTRVVDGAVELSVADNGAGMDAQALDSAFHPFFTTKPPGQGTGLGLAVCHSVVTAHGGRIEIDSAPGAGTTVRVNLPAAAEAA